MTSMTSYARALRPVVGALSPCADNKTETKGRAKRNIIRWAWFNLQNKPKTRDLIFQHKRLYPSSVTTTCNGSRINDNVKQSLQTNLSGSAVQSLTSVRIKTFNINSLPFAEKTIRRTAVYHLRYRWRANSCAGRCEFQRSETWRCCSERCLSQMNNYSCRAADRSSMLQYGI